MTILTCSWPFSWRGRTPAKFCSRMNSGNSLKEQRLREPARRSSFARTSSYPAPKSTSPSPRAFLRRYGFGSEPRRKHCRGHERSRGSHQPGAMEAKRLDFSGPSRKGRDGEHACSRDLTSHPGRIPKLLLPGRLAVGALVQGKQAGQLSTWGRSRARMAPDSYLTQSDIPCTPAHDQDTPSRSSLSESRRSSPVNCRIGLK